MDGPQRGTTPRWSTLAFFGLLAVLAGIVFAPSIRIGFIEDDFGYFARTLSSGWWYDLDLWDFSGQVLRPLTVIAIGVQLELFGFHPLPFHLVGLALVVLQGVLVHVVARRLGLSTFGARAAAAVMVLHTTNGWTLMWTAATSSLYSVNLALGCIALVAAPRVGRRALFAAAGLLALALLAREIAIMVPAMALLVRARHGEGSVRERFRRAGAETWPLWTVLGIFLAGRLGASGYAKTQPQTPRLIPILNWTSFREALPDSPRHLHDLFVLGSGPFRSTIGPDGLHFPVWVRLVAVAFWAVVAVFVVREYRAGRPIAALGVGWFLLGLFPPAFLQAEITYVNYADLAMPGLCLALGALLEAALAGHPVGVRRVAGAFGLALLAWVGFNGGNTLIKPPPPLITRAVELEAQARRDYPDPPRGSTIVITGSIPEDPLWTSNGDLFRALYDDPTLVVVFEPATDGASTPP